MRMTSQMDHHQSTPTEATFRSRKKTSISLPLFRGRRKTESALDDARTTRKSRPKEKSKDKMRRDQPPPATIRTSILSSYEPHRLEAVANKSDEHDYKGSMTYESKNQNSLFSNWLFSCGHPGDIQDDSVEIPISNQFPKDPSMEESFECVFATQLEDGLEHEDLWEDADDTHNQPPLIPSQKSLVSPARFHQSWNSSRRQRSRELAAAPVRKPRQTFRSGTLVHIGTYDPIADTLITSVPKVKNDNVVKKTKINSSEKASCPCFCLRRTTPKLSPDQWPQKPLLFRPTPGSGVKVKGIRFVNNKDYLWKVGDESFTWLQALHKHWGREFPFLDLGCPSCMILPINNGNEPENESLVVDFKSNLFEGTILLRLRHSNGSTTTPYNDEKGYFAGVNRQYQVVIQGSPLKELSFNDLMSGFKLERPCGKLPPKWILNGVLKVVSFFAPQMQTNLSGPKPLSISPLGSTPQLIRVNGNLNMELKQEEPTLKEETLLGVASDSSSPAVRSKFRKKNFDNLFSRQSKDTPNLMLGKVYTFEFLQHLINFREFTLEFGSMLGSISLKDVLDGQALPIMACSQDQKLWSFDLIHESIIEDSLRQDRII
jgi:Protein of unknown function (DUF1769)